MKMSYDNPTEEEECIIFHQWLELKKIPHHHIANESRSGKYGAIRGSKLKKMGQSKGFPDYLIVIPAKYDLRSSGFDGGRYLVVNNSSKWRGRGQRINDYFRYRLIAIEMKRKKGGAVALHYRVVALRGKPTKCAMCDKTDCDRYEWACVGSYKNPFDYVRLCVPCHRRLDKYNKKGGDSNEIF